MNDMQYYQMRDLLQAMVQTWGTSFETNNIDKIIKYISIPQVARLYPWRKIVKPISITTTNDTLVYNLPYDFDKFIYFKSKYGRLTELTPAAFHNRFPDRTDRKAQDFAFYAVEEFEGVRNQITTDEQITVESDSTSDTQKILVRGNVSNYDDYEELTLNGTSAVTSTKTFSEVAYVSKSEATLGRVTVKGATSGKTLTVISPEHLTAQYKRLVIDSNPQETLTLSGEYYSLVFKPVRDYDVFKIPADLVLLNALALLGWERRDLANQMSIEKKYQQELAIAIKYERKSYSIDSKMELQNESRKIIPDDYPLVDY